MAPRCGDGMCLYYSLPKTDGASLAGGLRQGINNFKFSASGTALGTTAILGAIQTEIGRSQTVLGYTDFMRKQKAWGGAIGVSLFSRLRGVPVKVFVRASSGGCI